MNIDLLQTLSLVAYIAAGVFLLVTAALFFLLDIPKTVGYLSGASARKAIESMRKQSEANTGSVGEKYTSGMTPKKVTDKMTKSGKLVPGSGRLKKAGSTERLDLVRQQVQAETTILEENRTGVETTILSENQVGTETTILSENQVGAETTVLSENQIFAGTAIMNEDRVGGGITAAYKFKVDAEMSFYGSSEIIE